MKEIAEKLNGKHISTGDLVREEINRGTALSKQLDDLISKGNLIPSEVTVSLIDAVITN